LEAYQATNGNHLSVPVPIEQFIRYGKWYQSQGVPGLDERKVFLTESETPGFRIILSDGAIIHARRVVVAAGIAAFAWRPSEYDRLPSELVSHTSEHRDFGRFFGKKVLVVGGGQSALEAAALLHEGGAEAEVVARSPRIHWLQGILSKTLHHRLGSFTRRLLYAPTDVGPAGLSQLLARPDLVRRLPRRLQDVMTKRAVRPAGARWLVDRLQQVPIHLGRSVNSVATVGGQVRVCLDDGSVRVADHVLLGTGYRVDIAKYDFLAPELKRAIRCVGGYPVLRPGLETSVDGLHILGAPAVWSFGPLMQFVSGTRYASSALLRQIAPKLKRTADR